MMNKISAIIVDDEPLARVNIKHALRECCDWQICGELGSGAYLSTIIKTEKPQVLFLDIHMPGENGINLAKQLITEPECPLIIFVTAFDQFAIQAFELFALDYLLKPFDDERFAKTIKRAENILANNQKQPGLQNWYRYIDGNHQPPDRLLIRSINSIRVVMLEDILWFKASGNYVEVHHCDGMHLHRTTLSFLETQLDKQEFFRIHRSAIIKLSGVREFKSIDEDQFMVILSDGSQVKVSSTYRQALIGRLAG